MGDIIEIINRSPTVEIAAGGPQGAAGVGVPAGGSVGQVLSKIDATNFNTQWVNPTGGGGGTTLDALTDTTIAGVLSGGELLKWSGTAWINNTLAEAGISAIGHGHTLSNISGAGTAAAKNIPATGDAATTEVVFGTDTRLADSRTPTAHTHPLSEITGSGTAAPLNVAATGDAAVGEVVKGDDTRLSDARTPSAHVHAAANTTSGVFDRNRVPDMIGASALAAGSEGQVPAPQIADRTKFLKGNGAWDVPVDTIQNLIKGITIESPTASEDISMFFTRTAITVAQLTMILRGSATPSLSWAVKYAADRSLAGTAIVTAGTTTTSTTTGSVVTTLNNASIPANSFVWFESTAQSGTVDECSLSIEYTET